MEKEFGSEDFASLDGSLNFDGQGETGGQPPMKMKMADISWVKNKKLDVPYAGESPNQVMDLYYPQEGEGPFAILLHIHGGGFGMGDKRDDHMDTYLKFLEKGIAVGSIEYRLSGEAIFPAAVLDCREAVRYLRKHAKEYHVLPDKIAVIGGSAGGNLSAMLGMNVPNGEFPGEEGKAFDTDCNVLFAIDQFGPIDFRNMDNQARANGISFVDHDKAASAESSYMGGALPELSDEWLNQANPMTYIGERMAPLLVEHGCMDRLVPFMQSVDLVNEIYRKLGQGRVEFVPLPNADHEDKEYSSEWNMDVLWSWMKKHLF
ncbi:MAG: alpha/beta hydrolase [Lachnospiraceae bacterium]|nr:alpha/beta hydrolase [Lachnospiraceae bacterium]